MHSDKNMHQLDKYQSERHNKNIIMANEKKMEIRSNTCNKQIESGNESLQSISQQEKD